MGKLPTSKRRMGNLLGFSFSTTTNLNQKEKLKISEKYFWIFSKFLNTEEESNKTNMDYIMKKDEHRLLE